MKHLMLILISVLLAACSEDQPKTVHKTEGSINLSSLQKVWECESSEPQTQVLNLNNYTPGTKGYAINWDECLTNYTILGDGLSGVIMLDDVKGCLNGPQTHTYTITNGQMNICLGSQCRTCY